jgi:hypothetical protein
LETVLVSCRTDVTPCKDATSLNIMEDLYLSCNKIPPPPPGPAGADVGGDTGGKLHVVCSLVVSVTFIVTTTGLADGPTATEGPAPVPAPAPEPSEGPPDLASMGDQPETARVENEFLRKFMSLDTAQRILIGHNFTDFVQSCTFRGRDCIDEE